jgi:hypothetical protein
MNDKIPIAKAVPIRDAGHDEVWLQNQIAETPSALELGDLEVVSKERAQATGGRLDCHRADQNQPPAGGIGRATLLA